MKQTKMTSGREDYYTRQARRTDELERSILYIVLVTAAILGLVQLWESMM